MKHHKLFLAGASLVVIALGVQLLERFNERMPAQMPLPLPTESFSNSSHASKASLSQPEDVSSDTNNSAALHSANKQARPARLAESPERLSSLAPLTPTEQQTADTSTLAARSQRSRTLNERLEKRLDHLRQQKSQANDAERKELEHAIVLLERNRDLRAKQQLTKELPRRELN